MEEEVMLAEKTQQPEKEKPKGFWNGALKKVRGENTTQLIENFTAEMTLVAEGLCEDQSKLRREINQMMTEEDQRIQRLESLIHAAESTLDEERSAHDRDLTELRNRLAALEKKAAKEQPAREKKKRTGTIIRDLTWLVGIAATAWVIVTLVNKLL